MFEAGDRVVVIGRTIGTAIATGSKFSIRIVHTWTLRESKVVMLDVSIDTPAMLTALGLPNDEA